MEEERGSTFGEIWQMIRKKIGLVLAVTLVLTAALTLAAEFWYSPAVTVYSRSFLIYFPGSESQKYPDGTPFYYRDIISEESLERVKASDGRFAGVNVKKMVSGDDISIERTVSASDEVLANHFTIGVRGSYFKDRESMNAFLYGIADLPRQYAIEKAAGVDFSLDEDTFNAAGYATKIELLALQRDSIVAQYDEWIGLYGRNYPVSGNGTGKKTLGNYRAEAMVTFSETFERSLTEELETYGYVPRDQLEARRNALEAERQENERKIEELKKALASVPMLASVADSAAEVSPILDISEMLAALIARNVELESQIVALTEENVEAFEARLGQAFTAQQELSASAKRVCGSLYENARISPDTSQAQSEGGLGLPVTLICSFAVSLLIACLCGYFLSRRETKKAPASAEGENGAEKT